HVKIEPAPVEHVAERAADARRLSPQPRGHGDIAELAAAEILEQGGNLRIVAGHEQVIEPVAVHVAEGAGETVSIRQLDAGFLRDVRERAVAIVAKKEVGPARVGDIQVRPTVAVDIAPGTGTGSLDQHASSSADVFKSSVTLVAIEPAGALA